MSSSAQSLEKFRLHVPLQTLRGTQLSISAPGHLIVLGHSATLHHRDLFFNDGPTQLRYWLQFDPLPKNLAEALFNDLKLRLPVLSLRQNILFTIPDSPLSIVQEIYNGPLPALIPHHITATPAWMDSSSTSIHDASSIFGTVLANCPAVDDDRIVAAIELAITSHYDLRPRSVFLSRLTILDSLAARADRSKEIQNWLEEKIKESRSFNDQGLVSALGNLKTNSHGSAVRDLVKRAALAMGHNANEIRAKAKLANELYRVRSSLSHADKSNQLTAEHVADAKQLSDLVINAAIQAPSILNILDNHSASSPH